MKPAARTADLHCEHMLALSIDVDGDKKAEDRKSVV